MNKFLLVAVIIVLLNSCKKDNPDKNLVSTKWSLSKAVILAKDTCEFQISSKDFIRKPRPEDSLYFSPKPIGSLNFTSLSDIIHTEKRTNCKFINLNRVCTDELVTSNGKYSIKNDSISFTIDNVVKHGKFLASDSLVIFTCAPLNFELPLPITPKRPYGWLLMGELYIRNK